MRELHLPWLELAVVIPFLGSLWVRLFRNPDLVRRNALLASGLALLCAIGAWRDFVLLHTFEAHDHWDVLEFLTDADLLVIDELSAPLIPLGALVYFLTMLSTLRTKVKRFSFARALVAESLLLATFACRQPWAICVLMTLKTLPPYLELRQRRESTRVYRVHMALFIGLLLAGQAFVAWEGSAGQHSTATVLILASAMLIRSGVAPLHCWMTDLFERASFGTALMFVTPMVGAYGAMRLVLPIAPDWVLQMISVASIFTALYAACMALVQTEVRRFFAYIFLSHSSLVLAGLESATSSGLTGALCVWLSVGLAMGGFGLTLRAIESRTGPLSLREFHGLYEHTPMLAVFFLLTGLAAIGFPGTIGFVALEILVEGAVDVTSLAGVAIVVATALNGLAVLWAYFRIFTGTRHQTSVDLSIRPAERFAVLVLTLLILGGGLLPQPGVASRHHAAMHLVSSRTQSGLHVDEVGSDHEAETDDDSPSEVNSDNDRDLQTQSDRDDATDNQSTDTD